MNLEVSNCKWLRKYNWHETSVTQQGMFKTTHQIVTVPWVMNIEERRPVIDLDVTNSRTTALIANLQPLRCRQHPSVDGNRTCPKQCFYCCVDFPKILDATRAWHRPRYRSQLGCNASNIGVALTASLAFSRSKVQQRRNCIPSRDPQRSWSDCQGVGLGRTGSDS